MNKTVKRIFIDFLTIILGFFALACALSIIVIGIALIAVFQKQIELFYIFFFSMMITVAIGMGCHFFGGIILTVFGIDKMEESKDE